MKPVKKIRPRLARTRLFLTCLVFVLGLLSGQAYGAASDWDTTDFTQTRLISSANTIGKDNVVTLGLHFKLKKGWKVYWRSPGDAGYPPSIKWEGSKNLGSAQWLWPAPERFEVLGFQTMGYTDEVVYPIKVTLAEPGKALHARANVNYLACSSICIPFESILTLTLPVGSSPPANEAHLLNRFETRVPAKGEKAAAQGLTIESVKVTGRAEKTRLLITAHALPAFSAPDVFVEGPNVLAFDPPAVSLRDNARTVELSVPVAGAKDSGRPLIGEMLTITLIDGQRGIEAPMMATAGTASLGNGTDFLGILLLAVLGGLILNLMPCVLPVLSLKLLGAISHGGREKREVQLSFLASAAGILFAFMVLATALVGLKMAGMAIGWGIQFQQPWFLIALAIVVTLFACNLWGFFEVHLPHAIADIGEHQSHIHGLGGHFMQGAFATLLATPCSAPFLGTAVGFALSRGSVEIYLVFAALGFGLALPFILIAIAPGLATRLPKPGPWMVTMKRILGFALLATALWLVSVLYSQISSGATLAILFLIAALTIIFYLRKKAGPRFRAAGIALAAITIVVAMAVPTFDTGARSVNRAAEKIKDIWVPFDEAAIPKLIAEGKIIFVDVTADWCITCQVNKALVIGRSPVFEELSRPDVIAMQADWTRPSDVIAAYLASFGRYGIPFNAVYGPGARHGAVLPELLTSKTVLKALQRARNPSLSAK